MALCRFVLLNAPSFPSIPVIANPALSSNICSVRGISELTHLPLQDIRRRRHFSALRSSSSLSSMDSPPEGYRKNVGICLINSSKKIFAASRLDIPDAWQMPQGGIDDGEDPRNAALRELKEETGVASVEVLAETSPSSKSPAECRRQTVSQTFLLLG